MKAHLFRATFMHSLFRRKYANWAELEREIEKISDDTEKGNAFEEFVCFYFDFHRDLYQAAEVYARVFFNRRIPKRLIDQLQLEVNDYGVDGVIIRRDGNLIAYQAKFRSGRTAPTARELATFWAEGEYAHFRCVVANTFSLPHVASKKRNHLSVLEDKFLALQPEFFDALFLFATQAGAKPKTLHSPRQYQREMLNDIASGFSFSNRGKLIAACGTGKTLVSLWATEELKTETVLFLAPSLALIRQTLGEWVDQAMVPFSYLCVCSDISISDNINRDEAILLPSDVDVPVTTDPAEITRFIETAARGKRVIFCTYQSLDVLSEGCAQAKNFQFDLTIFDEAHRTAGLRDSGLFSLAHDDSGIKSRKRLFMTATERMVRARVREIAEEAQRVVFSMDDQSVYGPVFHRLSFGKAITQKIIADYRIVLGGVTESEVLKLISTNRYVSPDVTETVGRAETAQNLFRELLLTRAIADIGITKAISFHSSVREAQRFVGAFRSLATAVLDDRLSGIKTFFGHVNGAQSASDRALTISEFEASGLGLLSNVRCLSEGVDIPLIDTVFFADPRNSPIDIVQAVGRALRQRYGTSGKIAYILVPLIIPEKGQDIEAANATAFEGLHNVIQAMRDQDETLAEWIDSINLKAVQGKTGRAHKGTGKLVLILPEDVDVEMFYEHLTVRIADVNRDPTGTVGMGSRLGKKERISTYTRVFKTFGDYNVDTYQPLVDVTVKKFRDAEEVCTTSSLKDNNNHNNVSHSVRLGVIAKIDNRHVRLTPLGLRYLKKKISFQDLFKNQMLLYSELSNGYRLFPYRAAFEVLRVMGGMNYIEFLYGIYSLQSSPDVERAVEETWGRVLLIRKKFPNVQLTNEANREAVRQELNGIHPVGFDAKDVWTDRTAAGNQYRYLTRHLELFDELFTTDWKAKTVSVKDGAEPRIKETLMISDPKHLSQNGGYGAWVWLPVKK
jgi:superfamily II DNA or RNA helicase